MTSNACYSRVSSAPTFAVLQAIRLQANTGNATDAGEHGVPPRAMACTAKVHRIDRVEFAGVEDQIRCLLVSETLLKNAGLHGVGMLCAGAVASFARDARREFTRLEFACDHRSGTVA